MGLKVSETDVTLASVCGGSKKFVSCGSGAWGWHQI